LTVQFTDLSTGDPDTWIWDFGDDTNSTDTDPLHIYTDTGFYTVSLTVENEAGENTTVQQEYINVKPMTGGETGYFMIHSNVDGAEVYFDDEFKGEIANGTRLVQVYISGTPFDKFSVIAGGYYPFVDNITDYPAENETIHLYANLSPIIVDFYYINASSGVGGAIVPSGVVAITPGSNMTFNITPISGYTIQTVMVDGDAKGALGTYTFSSVTGNHTIAASFRQVTSGGGGGGGGGGYSAPTTTPTTLTTNLVTGYSSGGDGGGANRTTPTTQVTEAPTMETPVTTPVPLTTVPPAQPFWARFPMAWLIPVSLLVVILAGLAYYYYQKEKGEELFEEK
jgi:PKD repeat protein